MELKVTQEPLENCQIQLTVEVDQARVDQELRKVARKLSNQYQFPGFRKGKAPYARVVQTVGKDALYAEFVDELGQEVYKQVLETEDIEPYGTASLKDIQYDPLRYVLEVPMDPQIDLGDYRNLRVEKKVAEVTEEQIEERLQGYREQHADWKDVDRASEYGDTLTIDVRSVLTEPMEGDDETVVLEETEWEVTPDEDNPTDPPGFDEALIGMKAGEEKTFTLSWPEESQSIYAGRSATFKIKVHKVQAYENAELTDELAKLIGPEYETVEDLRNSIRETLEEEAQSEADAAYLGQVLNAVLEQSTLNYPPIVIEDQLDAMLNDFEAQLRQYGIKDLDTYLENSRQTREQFRESQREGAVEIAERNLILSELIRLEGVTASDEDVEHQINRLIGATIVEDEADAMAAGEEEPSVEASSFEAASAIEESVLLQEAEEGGVGEEGDTTEVEEESDEDRYRRTMTEWFRDGAGRAMIESQILTEKAQERLVAIASGEDVPDPVPPNDQNAEGESVERSEDEADTPAQTAGAVGVSEH